MRLNIILACLVAVSGWFTCQKYKTPVEDKSAVTQPANTNDQAADSYPIKVAHVLGSNPDTAPTVMVARAPRWVQVPVDRLPAPTASRRAYLATGWWNLNMAYQPTDTTVHVNYKNKWLKFKEDQTFEVLVNNKPVDSGRWNWDETKNQIYLSCKDPYINNTWGVHDKGFVMIWIGNTDINVTGIQVRVIGSKSPPPSN